MAATGKNTIEKTIAELPEELQQVVAKWADRLDQQQAELPERQRDLETLLHLVATSDFAGKVLLREWVRRREYGSRQVTPAPLSQSTAGSCPVA
jgi:hypothetical protein